MSKQTTPAGSSASGNAETLAEFQGRPFSLELARSAAPLGFRVFNLTILERYRNDPRYYYKVTDCDGYIAAQDEHYAGEEMEESDKILLRHFGFAYDDEMNRAVAVFLKELAKLSAEHQQIWYAHIRPGNFRLHPLFNLTTVLGIWAKQDVVTSAFVWELHRVNEYCAVMERPPLFLRDFWRGDRPKNFCFLIRPTKKEFAEFCQTLDKMMSDNINRGFFHGEVPDKDERGNSKGTITLFREWLLSNWKQCDPAWVKSRLTVFKKVRDLRNTPAHVPLNDDFDPKYFQEQRSLLREAYETVSKVRQIFEDHPKVKARWHEFEKFDCEVLDY